MSGPSDSSTPSELRQARYARPPGATEILLVRHGESAAAREGEQFPKLDGHGDPDLHKNGLRQAELLAERLGSEDVAALYVTSLRRTVQTAVPLSAMLGLEPRVEPDLREVFLGDWDGTTFLRNSHENHPVVQEMRKQERWDVLPGAEPAPEFRKRVTAAIMRIAQRHPDQLVIVVTHGGVIAELLSIATGSRGFAFSGTDNGSISHLVVLGAVWRLRRFNDTAHLRPGFSAAPEPMT
jgi:probable phosphoglycerate mutase